MTKRRLKKIQKVLP